MERQADELLADRADLQCLKTIPGIGSVIALVIWAEAGDLRRFPHHRQLLKFCGLDLAKSLSGNFRGKDKLSKRGNARLRCALWMVAMSAARMRENVFRDKYTRYTAGAPDDTDLKRKARTAITAKMARVVYALVKHGQPYRQRFDVDLPSCRFQYSLAKISGIRGHWRAGVPDRTRRRLHVGRPFFRAAADR